MIYTIRIEWDKGWQLGRDGTVLWPMEYINPQRNTNSNAFEPGMGMPIPRQPMHGLCTFQAEVLSVLGNMRLSTERQPIYVPPPLCHVCSIAADESRAIGRVVDWTKEFGRCR